MFGISYGEIFLLLGATAALIGPKDLPIIARTAGRLVGRAIGYVQMARGQFESVMSNCKLASNKMACSTSPHHHARDRRYHELQDTMAQLEAIRHEIRSISFINPGPLTTRLVDNVASHTSSGNVDKETSKPFEENSARVKNAASAATLKDHSSPTLDLSDIHRQATAYTRLAESTSFGAKSTDEVLHELIDESDQFIVFPVSAKSAGLLPNRKDDLKGSDILLEAVLEADVAHNAKDYFSQPQNQKD